ncbi:MAG: NAD(P)H-hydrate dehydratase [Nanoarchaeota archaeon]
MVMNFERELEKFWKKRKPGSYKGENGRALVIGGSREYAGCLALAGVASLRTGCDWVTIAAPEKVAWAVNALSPDLVTVKLEGDYLADEYENRLMQLVQKHDVFLIGNGMDARSDKLIRSIVLKNKGNQKVLDAQALHCVRFQEVSNAVLTPHKGEFDVLMKSSGLPASSRKMMNAAINSIQQRLTNETVILLKAETDIIIGKKRTAYNKGGNPGMTKAGTGDVLAGLVLGFLAQGMEPFKSCLIASWLNKKLGDDLKTKKGYSYIASDLLRELEEFKKKTMTKRQRMP